ncbi:MAG: hypothetical protein GWN94_04395 [Phycisphaerae bacterium]|nr:hypothetical protein [Phycisphaerae bacterium]
MNNKSSILLFLAFLLVGLGTGAQCNGTPEPPVSPISPVEVLPVEDIEVMTTVIDLYELNIHWDDPNVTEGYTEVYCLNLPAAELFVEWKVTTNNPPGLMIASGAELVDIEPPTEIGTGIAAGPILIQAELEGGQDVTLWHRIRWNLANSECIDAGGNIIVEITPGVFVPLQGETYQDAEGYWYTVERYVPQEHIPVYLPLITKDDFE